MKCPHWQSGKTVKNGKVKLQDQSVQQRYLCQGCNKRFNERTSTPMARLRTPVSLVAAALNVRTEGLGVRATGRSFGKSHATIIRWEQRLASRPANGHPLRLTVQTLPLKGMKFTLAWARTFPPSESAGWTIHFIERTSRYWVQAQAGQKTNQLFEQGTCQAWTWANPATSIRWFTDGERRYGQALWQLASVRLKTSECHPDYPYRKVWRDGLEVAMKIKGSQGRRRVEWVRVEHPFTAISPARKVHANHNEAQNSALTWIIHQNFGEF